ncbi:MAG: triose-phosphate isomerase [Megasphaera lornae]
MAAALQHGLTRLFAAANGTTATGGERTIFGHQLRMALAKVRMADASRVIVAYEPIWAIGTGQTATVTGRRPAPFASPIGCVELDIAATVPILYGGSMKADNAAALLAAADIDGSSDGGASLQAASFTAIILAADTI